MKKFNQIENYLKDHRGKLQYLFYVATSDNTTNKLYSDLWLQLVNDSIQQTVYSIKYGK